MKTSLVILALIGVFALTGPCKAQSTQEINRQQHYIQMEQQQRQILQRQFIQQQQLEQMRRDAEFRFNSNQSNRNLDPSYLHQPRY